METYKNIDEFIEEVFPEEYEKIIKRKQSKLEKFIEQADADFDEKLKGIINENSAAAT